MTADCSVMSNGVPADCRAERVMEVEQVERDQRGQSALRPSLCSEGVRGVRREACPVQPDRWSLQYFLSFSAEYK